jgi:hypothetical protein
MFASLKRATENGKKLDFSPKERLKVVVSEACKTLATSVPILLTLPVSVASCEHAFSKIN